jgi:hypothetical protein
MENSKHCRWSETASSVSFGVGSNSEAIDKLRSKLTDARLDLLLASGRASASFIDRDTFGVVWHLLHLLPPFTLIDAAVGFRSDVDVAIERADCCIAEANSMPLLTKREREIVLAPFRKIRERLSAARIAIDKLDDVAAQALLAAIEDTWDAEGDEEARIEVAYIRATRRSPPRSALSAWATLPPGYEFLEEGFVASHSD